MPSLPFTLALVFIGSAGDGPRSPRFRFPAEHKYLISLTFSIPASFFPAGELYKCHTWMTIIGALQGISTTIQNLDKSCDCLFKQEQWDLYPSTTKTVNPTLKIKLLLEIME